MYFVQRKKMIEKYVVNAGVHDQKVIRALERVPRHLFIDNALIHQAYRGASLPIGFGQTISHPTTVALMTQILELNGDEKVLEIGTGSGYQATILAEIGVKVFTIERIPELAGRARKIFEKLGYYSIALKVGDGYEGWPKYAPFNRIILTAFSSQIPSPLLKQLEVNGILVMPEGNESHQKIVKIFKQSDGDYIRENITDANFVPLIKNRS
jgi:protein-L-isoaspartate(D-aspartate) O-methyltransferase